MSNIIESSLKNETESMIKSRRRIIIKKIAEELFIEQGIMTTTAQLIAEKSGVGRRTFYHYYTSKEEIAYEIYHDFIKQINYFDEHEIIEDTSNNGFEKTVYLFNKLIVHYKNNVNELKYLNDFALTYKITTPPDFISIEFDHCSIYNTLFRSMSRGIDDHSICTLSTTEIKIFILSVFHSLVSFISQIGLNPAIFHVPYEFNVDDCTSITNFYLKSIQNN